MNFKNNEIKNKTIAVSTRTFSFLIPIFQYVPCTAVWFGIMSVPIITYIFFFFQDPTIITSDIQFLFRSYGTYITLFGIVIFSYAFIYQLTHRKQLLTRSIYNYTRNPQYLGFIILTLGMTLVVFNTSPIINITIPNFNHKAFIFTIWIGQTFAYIFLAKIEEIALKAKYQEVYTEYKNNTPFLLPFIKIQTR